jgi:multidrug efflux system membrane fusion protein
MTARSFSMRPLKLSLAALATVAVVAVAGVRIAGEQADGGADADAPPPAMMAMPVPVVSVVKKTLPIYLDYPGRIESIHSIALQARVSGYIESQPAADGADVKTGDLLYRIDPRDLQAALDQANAQAQRDQASVEYARASYARGEELVKSGFVATDVYDQRASAMRQGEAALVADRAAVEATKLNLGYAEIRAPFSGRLGRNLAAKGALVGPASGSLNTLVELDPIYVTFNPSESQLAEIVAARAAGKVEAEVSEAGEPQLTRKGELTFLDNGIDKATRHHRSAGHHRQRRFRLATLPICSGAAAREGRAGRADGGDGGARLGVRKKPLRGVPFLAAAKFGSECSITFRGDKASFFRCRFEGLSD